MRGPPPVRARKILAHRYVADPVGCVLHVPMAAEVAGQLGGVACSAVSEVTAYTVSVVARLVLPLRVRVIRTAWAVWGNPIPAAIVTTLYVRVTRRPWLLSVSRCPSGTVLQGSAANWLRSVFWVPLTVSA